VVVIVIVALAVLAPGVTSVGETLHVDNEGVPEHANEIGAL
jgi:hypothetical protein